MTTTWTRSGRCSGGDCIEVRLSPGGGVEVRDSKLGDTSPVIAYTADAWADLVADTKTGPVPLSSGADVPWSVSTGVDLWFTADEWNAFVDGVVAGDFDPDRLAVGDR